MSRSASGHAVAYRTLVLLYPRSFRHDYRDLMVRAFEDDLEERGARRAWSRTLGDLLVSVPVQRMEATVSESSPSRRLRAGLAVSLLALVAVLAMGRYVVITGAIIIVVAAATLLYWRSRLPYREAVADAGAMWWRVIVAGAALLGGIGVAATYGPEMDWFPWHLAAFLYLTAWVAMIVGALLGVLQLTRRLRHRPVSL